MGNGTRILTMACLLAAGVFAQQPPPVQKKRLAVLNFDYATVYSGISGIFGSNVDVGKGIADILVEKFVTDGRYGVYERKAIDKIMSEQNLSNSDRADPSSAAKLGRIMGVDAIVIGSITQFGRDDKTTKVGGGAFGGITGRYGIGGVGRRESKAVVAVTARLVATDTGEILATATGQGESTRSGTALLGSGGSSIGGAGGAYDMSSRNFAATILGDATHKAVTQLAGQLESQEQRIPARVANVDGLVADVNGSEVVLNVGTRAGVRPGMKLYINRVLRTVKDPATGKVIRRLEDKVGEVTITQADEQSSVGTFSGSGTPKVGDTAKNNP